MDKDEIRKKIKGTLFKESHGYVADTDAGHAHRDDRRLDPEDVVVNDDTVGVIEYKYDPKQMQDVEAVLNKIDPYFEDIEVQYVGLNDEFEMVSVNIKHKYKNLCNALMDHFGFEKDQETWGDEDRGPKRTYASRSTMQAGSHGNYAMPFLLGELPEGGFGGWHF